MIPASYDLIRQTISGKRFDIHIISGAGRPSANGARETSTLGDGSIETARAIDVVASGANHKLSIENEITAATTLLLGGKKIVFHSFDHDNPPQLVELSLGVGLLSFSAVNELN
jgi:hypothetical protein